MFTTAVAGLRLSANLFAVPTPLLFTLWLQRATTVAGAGTSVNLASDAGRAAVAGAPPRLLLPLLLFCCRCNTCYSIDAAPAAAVAATAIDVK